MCTPAMVPKSTFCHGDVSHSTSWPCWFMSFHGGDCVGNGMSYWLRGCCARTDAGMAARAAATSAARAIRCLVFTKALLMVGMVGRRPRRTLSFDLAGPHAYDDSNERLNSAPGARFPMAAPRPARKSVALDATSADTKTRILDAAEALFTEHGFEATSLRQLTAAAGVNLAAVNYHFGSKEELFQAVLTRRLDPMNQERIELLEALEREAGTKAPSCEKVLFAML